MKEIKQLLFKDIFDRITEEEKERLESWLATHHENRELYDKIHSASFLEKAMTDDNRSIRRQTWKIIGKQVSSGRRYRIRRFAMRAAAVAIPVIAGALWIATDMWQKNTGSALMMEIRPGSPKVMVTLSNGEEMVFGEKERIAVMQDGTTTIVNEDNTLRLTSHESMPDEYTSYKIPSGGEYAVKLSDGTIVYMNSESELRAPVRFGEGKRTVYFKGEGFFEVAKDQARPFIVQTDYAGVEVLGTEFNVRAYADEENMYTTLISGSVNILGEHGSRVPMTPGTQATVSANGGIVVRTVDTYPYVAWTSGRIVFENARTEDIMKVLKRWYNCEVYFGDDAVKERRFTMDILKYDDITEILDLMSKVNVHYIIKGNEIHIGSK